MSSDPGASSALAAPATSPTDATSRQKLLPLEGARGLAAMIVVAWHFIWAFAPRHLGSVAGFHHHAGLVGNPLLAVIDGPAAVALFFVLSGLVLPLGFLRSGRTRVVAHAAVKRWLRLAGLAVPAVILAYLMFHLDLFHYRGAARVTRSDWLGSYGGGDPHGSLSPSLGAAVQEGLFGAFLRGSNTYDPALWTMHHELLGSFLSLAIALLVRGRSGLFGAAVLLAAAAAVGWADPWLIPFVAGTGLALRLSRHPLRLRGSAALACLAMGLYLFGYLEPRGVYAWMRVMQDQAGYRYDRILLQSVAGVLLIVGVISHEGIGRALSTRPLRFLGRTSFPVYLFHFPLQCSLGCGVFVLLLPVTGYGLTLALVALVYLPVVLAVGVVFARADEIWVVWLNRGTDRLLNWLAGRWRARPALSWLGGGS